MKLLIYFIFIVYIGLLASNFTIVFLSNYVNNETFSISKEIFYDPIRFSLIGGTILAVVNKIFPTKTDKKK